MAKDFIRGADNKLVIRGGRFVFEEADEQGLRILAMSEPGDFGINLLLGGRLKRFPNARGTDISKSLKNLKLQLDMDGWKKGNVSFANGQVSLEGDQ